MKIGSFTKLGGITVLTALLLAGCGQNSSQSKKKELTWVQQSNMTTMDISKVTDQIGAQTLNNSNEGLLRMAEHNRVIPGVAKNYTVSKDGKTWTFNLRHSKWSDGTPVTAKDFVYSWRRTVNPKTAGQYAYIFMNIKNAAKINAGKLSPTKLGVRADGNYRLVVTLKKPQSYFKYLVADVEFFPQKASTVKKYGQKYGTTSKAMVYNGPFKMTGWTGTNDTWHLVKNPRYWNAKQIKLDKINFRVIKTPETFLNEYQDNKVQVTPLSGQQVKQYRTNKDYVLRSNAATWYLEMNQHKYKFFRNVNIRKALSLTIDRKQFTGKVLADGSMPAKGFVAADMSTRNGQDYADAAYEKGAVASNLALAKKYWAKGLKQTGKKSVSFNLMADDTDAGKKTTEYLQSRFTKLPGLKITNQNIPYKTRLARSQDGQFDMVVTEWIADFPDPITFLQLMQSNNAYNNGPWQNKTYDKLTTDAEGKDANRPAARWQDMVKAGKLLANQEGVIPLYQQAQPQLVKSDVKGIQSFPTAPLWDWRNVTVK